MVADILGMCPVCGNNTEVKKIGCEVCGTTIEGRFKPCKFCKLTAEQKYFIEIFIKCRGNIKEVEKELGISYPTVKNRLEDVALALGYKLDTGIMNETKRKEVLNRLNNGEITVEQALELLGE